MKRNRVFNYNRSEIQQNNRNRGYVAQSGVQTRTIEYMEDFAKMGFWTYNFRSNMVYTSKGAIKILNSDQNKKFKRLDRSSLTRFDHETQNELYSMALKARSTKNQYKTDVSLFEEDGSEKKLRIMQTMADGDTLLGIIQNVTSWYDREKDIRDQLKLIQDVIDSVPIPVFMKNMDGEYKHCNKALLKMLAIERAEIIGKTSYDVASPLEVEKYIKTDEDLVKHGGVIKYETSIQPKNKKAHVCMLEKVLLKDTKDTPIGIVGTLRDITEDKKKSDHIQKLMTLKDAMMEITHAIMDNRSETDLFHLILEKGLAAIDRADHGTVLMLEDDGFFRPVAWNGYGHEIESFEVELSNSYVWRASKGQIGESVLINDISQYNDKDVPDVSSSNSGMTVKASLCSPIIVEGEVIGLMNLDSTLLGAFDSADLALSEYMREQLEIALTRRKLYDKVVYLSRHDELTGLYNRRFFEEYAERTLKRSKRYNEKFCLAVFDLNGLKHINDTYGHQCGDSIIKMFAQTLDVSFRETDIFGRYGGDEFVGIFLESDKAFLCDRLNVIEESLKDKSINCGNIQVTCSFSYGVASYPEDGDSYNKLVSVADKNMYDFKKAHKKS